MKIPKQAYTIEFKELAVRRIKDGQSVSKVCRELGLSDQTLRNWVKAAAEGKLNGAGGRVVRFPSRFEGFGYAVLEAMACGKPVIATSTAALPEVVKDGATGILCSMGDVSAFVEARQYLLANPEVAKKYGLTGRRRAVLRFSEEIILPRYVELYDSLVGGDYPKAAYPDSG